MRKALHEPYISPSANKRAQTIDRLPEAHRDLCHVSVDAEDSAYSPPHLPAARPAPLPRRRRRPPPVPVRHGSRADAAEPGGSHPLVEELAAAWEAAAWRNGVFPLQDAPGALALHGPAEEKLGRRVTLLPGTPELERYRPPPDRLPFLHGHGRAGVVGGGHRGRPGLARRPGRRTASTSRTAACTSRTTSTEPCARRTRALSIPGPPPSSSRPPPNGAAPALRARRGRRRTRRTVTGPPAHRHGPVPGRQRGPRPQVAGLPAAVRAPRRLPLHRRPPLGHLPPGRPWPGLTPGGGSGTAGGGRRVG